MKMRTPDTMRLVGDLFAYVWSGRDNNCNSYVLAGVLQEGRHVVIDPGHVMTPALREAGLQRLYESMQQDGVDPEAVGLVILTHCHPDHSEAADVMKDQTGALVALHQAEADLYGRFGGEADVFLDEGSLELGIQSTLHLTVFHSPGHSPGHITLYWPQARVLIAGDLIFHRSTGRVDLPGGDPDALKRSIERLSELELEYVLCGHPYGHPGIIEGVDEVRRNFEFLRTHVLV